MVTACGGLTSAPDCRTPKGPALVQLHVADTHGDLTRLSQFVTWLQETVFLNRATQSPRLHVRPRISSHRPCHASLELSLVADEPNSLSLRRERRVKMSSILCSAGAMTRSTRSPISASLFR